MSNINNTIPNLEHPQVCWVMPDIDAAVKILSKTLGIVGFPKPEQYLNMTYDNNVVTGEWLTTQAYNGGTFIELVQPVWSKYVS